MMTSVDLDLIYGKVKLDLNCSKSFNGGKRTANDQSH